MCRSGKCRSENGWKAVRLGKEKVGPMRYQQLEQSMIGCCENYCKDTKAVPEYVYMPTAHQSSI